jgi:hypothetical protein
MAMAEWEQKASDNLVELKTYYKCTPDEVDKLKTQINNAADKMTQGVRVENVRFDVDSLSAKKSHVEVSINTRANKRVIESVKVIKT